MGHMGYGVQWLPVWIQEDGTPENVSLDIEVDVTKVVLDWGRGKLMLTADAAIHLAEELLHQGLAARDNTGEET